ncbi:hypothetical protein AMTR_s03576p00008700 [Amborella trichopoda]|uniref:Uncharacterized protein n=2 Tax=Amborella trichopoda TaxID=13333 RepID=U5D035_AMBTC|nr:hypothetical protein AMTR_s03576p00008700 [Amborella trichopoda]
MRNGRITSDPKEEEKQDGNFPEKKLHLLKALQHSQTRAREAEKQASQAQLDKENVVALFFKESSRSFAYRQWLKLLEAEILMLQSNLYKPNPISPSARIEGEKRETAKTKNNRENGLVDTLWGFAGFTFCLESVGFLMGWKLANVCSIQGFDFTSIWRNLCSDC